MASSIFIIFKIFMVIVAFLAGIGAGIFCFALYKKSTSKKLEKAYRAVFLLMGMVLFSGVFMCAVLAIGDM